MSPLLVPLILVRILYWIITPIWIFAWGLLCFTAFGMIFTYLAWMAWVGLGQWLHESYCKLQGIEPDEALLTRLIAGFN